MALGRGGQGGGDCMQHRGCAVTPPLRGVNSSAAHTSGAEIGRCDSDAGRARLASGSCRGGGRGLHGPCLAKPRSSTALNIPPLSQSCESLSRFACQRAYSYFIMFPELDMRGSDISDMPWVCPQFRVAAVSQKLLSYNVTAF